ncbi:hypothetical protein ACG0Z6_10855 [Roseateles sp. BYS180W]|uniref:Uncharacterized protein n=1 Tax=Roseateles rivi TaxID=3299028 RepID=A0ABW7FWR1_9BURK
MKRLFKVFFILLMALLLLSAALGLGLLSWLHDAPHVQVHINGQDYTALDGWAEAGDCVVWVAFALLLALPVLLLVGMALPLLLGAGALLLVLLSLGAVLGAPLLLLGLVLYLVLRDKANARRQR